MAFVQEPPALGNQFADDRLLRSYLERTLPSEVRAAIEPELSELGELAGGELYRLQLEDLASEPRLTRWDAWGHRIDAIEPTAVWRHAERLAAQRGLIAVAYERTHGRFSRPHQFALIHLFTPSTDIYSCPLAMTDGAMAALLAAGDEPLIERYRPRLISRDPERFWTSGQWMTETSGGSDVAGTETVARRDGDSWRLWGRKWFTSATASPMALTLARPEGAPAGSRGLALFLLETRDGAGRPNGIRIERLKDKLGTRKLPTAELFLDGASAAPVGGLDGGVRRITPMLNITRAWNAASAVALMRRALALATDYAGKRLAFGRPLDEQPLHVETLADLEAEYEGAFHLSFLVAELLGRVETGAASATEAALLRLVTPIAKLLTARQAVAVASEALECFGGAGYLEDTGLPVLLRDSQVLTIWEGTTNVLALDLLRALAECGGPEPLCDHVGELADSARDPALQPAAATVRAAAAAAAAWLAATRDETALETGARRLALTLGRSLETALALRHAQWALDRSGDRRSLASALRLATNGVDRLPPLSRRRSETAAAER